MHLYSSWLIFYLVICKCVHCVLCVWWTSHCQYQYAFKYFSWIQAFFNVRHVQPPHTYSYIYVWTTQTLMCTYSIPMYIQTVCCAACMEEEAKLGLLMRDDVRWCARSSLNPRIKMNRFAVQWICYMHIAQRWFVIYL